MSSIKLHDLFHVGQFVPTVVKEIDSSKHGYKKVVLSVDPKDLNAKLKVKLVVENMVSVGVLAFLNGFVLSYALIFAYTLIFIFKFLCLFNFINKHYNAALYFVIP